MTPDFAQTIKGLQHETQPARLAWWLGLTQPDARDDVGMARSVANGLKTNASKSLRQVLGDAMIIGPVVPEATFRRASKARKPLSRDHSERLYDMGRVVDAATHAYHGDTEAMRRFLTRPHPLLDGQTPFDLARSSTAGANAVVSLIERAEAGLAF